MWYEDLTRAEYDSRVHANQLDLILGFDASYRVVDVYIHANREIASGDEVGITYGYEYWTSE